MITWQETRIRLRADRTRLEAHFHSVPRLHPTTLWLQPSYQCVVLHRISFYFHSSQRRLLARFFWHLNLLLTGCDIAPLSDIGGGLIVQLPLTVTIIGTMGSNCTVQGHGGLGGDTRRHRDIGAGPGLPVVGDDVVLGWGALVMGPIRIGHRAVIGCGAVVANDVWDDAIVPDGDFVLLRSRVSA